MLQGIPGIRHFWKSLGNSGNAQAMPEMPGIPAIA